MHQWIGYQSYDFLVSVTTILNKLQPFYVSCLSGLPACNRDDATSENLGGQEVMQPAAPCVLRKYAPPASAIPGVLYLYIDMGKVYRVLKTFWVHYYIIGVEE